MERYDPMLGASGMIHVLGQGLLHSIWTQDGMKECRTEPPARTCRCGFFQLIWDDMPGNTQSREHRNWTTFNIALVPVDSLNIANLSP